MEHTNLNDDSPNNSQTNLKLIARGRFHSKSELRQWDDAFFICHERQTLGIADGVGSKGEKGITYGGNYARLLMHNALISTLSLPPGARVHPRAVLLKAYRRTRVTKGSSTACIATLRNSPNHSNYHHILHVVNVGDSGFMVFRNNVLLARSNPQQHRFNRPYQLGNGEKHDKPESAMEFRIGVESGDIVVLGTDGVFDNMYVSEIEKIIGSIKGREEEGVRSKELAREIAAVALRNSLDRFKNGPFAEAAQMAGFDYRGGKIDDITVVVGCIVSCARVRVFKCKYERLYQDVLNLFLPCYEYFRRLFFRNK